jgi:uracil-DNA glycosylase family 4
MFKSSNNSADFAELVADVKACVKCDRMCGSARVLNYSGGNLNADLFFIGEAPGRLGADETEVPFHGDVSGRNFEDLLAFAGITRDDIFVSNAVLCNPKDEDGNNDTPNPLEVANCAPFLKRQITVINPKIVITLGAVALRSLSIIEPHKLVLREIARSTLPPRAAGNDAPERGQSTFRLSICGRAMATYDSPPTKSWRNYEVRHVEIG